MNDQPTAAPAYFPYYHRTLDEVDNPKRDGTYCYRYVRASKRRAQA